MLQAQRCCLWRCAALAAFLCAIVCAAPGAKEASALVEEAERHIAAGDLKAAEIELKNAVSESPDDPAIRRRLAELHLQLGDAAAAELEARRA